MIMPLSRRSFRPPRALLALLALLPALVGAADIYVLDARIEREGRSALAPTFIVTPGERALMVFDGETDIDVAMTVMPRTASGGKGGFDVRVELIDGMDVFDEMLDVTLARPTSVQLGEREIVVLVRVQEALEGETAAGSAEQEATSAGEEGAAGTEPKAQEEASGSGGG